MTMLPAVRERLDLAAAQRARASDPRPRPNPFGAAGRPEITLGAAAAIFAVTLVLLVSGRTASHARSARASAAPVAATELFTPATPARLRSATDLRWDPALPETLP